MPPFATIRRPTAFWVGKGGDNMRERGCFAVGFSIRKIYESGVNHQYTYPSLQIETATYDFHGIKIDGKEGVSK